MQNSIIDSNSEKNSLTEILPQDNTKRKKENTKERLSSHKIYF